MVRNLLLLSALNTWRCLYKLCFNQHIDNVCKIANSVLGFVRRNFKNCSCEIKEDLYFTDVKPVVEYAAAVWAPHSRRSMNKLELYKDVQLVS